MSKYLCKINYVNDLAKGLLQEGGTSRYDQAQKTFASVGGTLESMYYAFGETDVYAIVDLPNHASAAALLFTARAVGLECNIEVLMAPAELDDAAKKSPIYRPPGA